MVERSGRALVIPGAALDAAGAPREALRARLEVALAEASRDLGAWVVVSGGAVNTARSEAGVMASWLVTRGLAETRLLIEGVARSTMENADLVMPLLVSRGVTRVTVISQPLHARRMMFNLRVASRRVGIRLAIDRRLAPLPPSQGAWCWRFAETFKLLSDATCRVAPSLARVFQGRPW